MDNFQWDSDWGRDDSKPKFETLNLSTTSGGGQPISISEKRRPEVLLIVSGALSAIALLVSLATMVLSLSRLVATSANQPEKTWDSSSAVQNSLFHEPENLGALIDNVHGATVTVYCGTSAGSGWGIDLGDDPDSTEDDAYPFEIVTNFHVIEECQNGEPITVTRDADDPGFEARLYSFDDSKYTTADGWGDLAILMTDTPINHLPTSPEAPSAGEWVMAAGNPASSLVASLDGHLTFGRISNFMSASSLIITDAALNHGNSGGPLVNSRGEVVGTNTWRDVSQDSENIAYAIGIPVICEKLVQCPAGDDMRWGK